MAGRQRMTKGYLSRKPFRRQNQKPQRALEALTVSGLEFPPTENIGVVFGTLSIAYRDTFTDPARL